MEVSDFGYSYGFALALAIKKHLHEVEVGLEADALAPGLTQAQVIAGQDTRNEVQIVRSIAMNQIITHYMQSESQKRPESVADSSLLYNFEAILLGPELTSYDVPSKFSTKVSIKEIESGDGGPKLGPLPREDELSARFYGILTKAVSIHKIYYDDASFKDQDLMSYVAGIYLREMIDNFPDITFSTELVYKMERVIAFLMSKANWKVTIVRIYQLFVHILKAHLELIEPNLYRPQVNYALINKLREQGNNLMNNSAYAQAIKVYTNALDLSRFPSSKSAPQLFLNRAIAFIGLNCFPEAITDLDHAIHLDKSFTPAWTQLGYCHLYMGNGLTALKSYLMALKSAVGELSPQGITDLDKVSLRKYKSIKMKHILPQFIHRLCQSIGLTEKRAYQQNEPNLEIKRTVAEVKRILANLRAECPESDRDYFVYYPQLRDSNLRSTTEASNRSRPNILTREIAQNMLASGGMETVTVSNPRMVTDTTRGNPTATDNINNNNNDNNDNDNDDNNNNNNNNTTNNTNNAPNVTNQANVNDINSQGGTIRPDATTAPTPAVDIRRLLNNFGGLFENARNVGGEGGQQQQGENINIGDIFSGAIQGGVENILSQFTGGGEAGRVFVNGREIDPARNNHQNHNHNDHDNSGAENSTDQDIHMPDDLD